MAMPRTLSLALTAVLFACPDVPELSHLRPQPMEIPTEVSVPDLPLFQNLFQGVTPQLPPKPSRLRAESELAIVRYVSGEFARVVRPVPSGKKGFKIEPGETFDDAQLRQLLTKHGSAANPGDTVQITRIDFKDKEIVIELNGGGRKHHRWRDHISIGVGGAPMPQVTTNTIGPSSGVIEARGATLVLDYKHGVPDMSPDDLKQALSAFLDFSKERSAAVHWVDTLPAEFRQAIKDRRAVVGMDHEMVVAALGRPDHKVRERNESGDETEDWIYGQPPAKTIFVTFIGDRVVRVHQYP
jgi:hypothetical protein